MPALRARLRRPFVRTLAGAAAVIGGVAGAIAACSEAEQGPVACPSPRGNALPQEGAPCTNEGATCGGHCDDYPLPAPLAFCERGAWRHTTSGTCNPPCFPNCSPPDTGTKETGIDSSSVDADADAASDVGTDADTLETKSDATSTDADVADDGRD